jgi:hypothetical protein
MTDLIKHYRQLVGIAKGWALKNLPGWNEDTHRDLLTRHGAVMMDGRVSASTMNVPQLGAVLDDYERRGWPRHKQVFQPGWRGTSAQSVPPRIAHLVRLWGKLGQAGKVARATRPALLAFCARQVGREVPDLDSLAVTECQRITEALKGWLGRE